MPKQKIPGQIMGTIGFLMLSFNAVGYVFGWETKHPSLTILGLIFVVIGLKMARQPAK